MIKKLLSTFLASLIVALTIAPVIYFKEIRQAWATVSCAVPFNLTNGTTADASQVMANYNAILTCLSTSAASSGSNSDITSLNNLTTPITPVQGGAQALCGASNFKVAFASPTTLAVTYSQALATNPTNVVQFSTNGSFTLNFGTTGANGLDTGALAASAFYYLYLISNGTTFATLASLSSTTPLLPGGYTYSCRVGTWESGNTSVLLTAQINGRRFSLLQKSGGTGSNINTNALQQVTSSGNCTSGAIFGLATFPGISPTAVRAFGVTIFNTSGSAFVSSYLNNGDLNSFFVGQNVNSNGYFDIALPSSQQFYTCINTAGAILVAGWEDAVNAN